jgi:orotate phosphoribosyltransferase
MRPEDVLKLLESVGAIRQGHFELSSGLHSATYVQCALVLQHPQSAEQLGRALAAAFSDLKFTCVASPALGGIILGHEVARALGVRAVFTERDASGQMALRRGFELKAGEQVLVVEDVWTTGASTVETIRVIEQAGGRVVGAGAMVDRSPRGAGRLNFSVPAKALARLEIEHYLPSECPLCSAGSKPERPGSRAVRREP